MSHLFNKHMARALRIIAQGGKAHPLHFLLADTGKWKGRWGRQSTIAVQAGHGTSKFSGHAERFYVQDADYNQMESTPERKGHVMIRQGIDIGGVPVEFHTALYWKELGHLPGLNLDSAAKTLGW